MTEKENAWVDTLHFYSYGENGLLIAAEDIIKDQRGWTYYASLFEDRSFAKEIRLNSLGKWLLDRERNYFTKVNGNRKKQNDGFIISGFFGAIITLVQQSAAYAYLIYCVVSGTISIGAFTMYTSAVTTFSTAFRKVLDSLIEIQAYDTYYGNLDEYLNLPKTLREGNELIDANRTHFIEFRNVSFRYSGSDTYALKNVNITIPFGQKLSIVGENGAGKTTFVKLLTRMYDPTEGGDPKAEYELYQRFNEMVQGKTAIYISHRLSSTKFCDVIAVFSNGQIIEYGSHDELYSKGGLYTELFSMQAQFYC